MRANCKDPLVFLLRYKDGLECAVYMLNGHLSDFTFAAEVAGKRSLFRPCSGCNQHVSIRTFPRWSITSKRRL